MQAEQSAAPAQSTELNAGLTRWEGHLSNGVGATYGQTPMAFMDVSPTGITFSSSLGNFNLPRAAVTKIGRASLYPWFFSGIRIHHTSAHSPEELQFKSLTVAPRAILRELRMLGYPAA